MGALRDRMTSHMELRGLSPRTIDVYLRQMTCCRRCHRLLYDKQRFNTRLERRGQGSPLVRKPDLHRLYLGGRHLTCTQCADHKS